MNSKNAISDNGTQQTSGIDWQLHLPRPNPSAGNFAYKKERWIALATSPRRLANYIRYQRASRRTAEVNYFPTKLDIENVSRCNFRCTMCQVSEWTNQKRAEDMEFDDFKHLIDHQPGLLEIKLQGMGEPILGGETYFNMIKYARKKHIWVRTVTNASMLHLRDNYKKLVDSGVNEIQISIDGATKETFEKIRVGSKFEVVKSNCKLINDYCKEKGVKRTKMWTTVQRDNVAELPQLIELATELGFNSVVFSLNIVDWGQSAWNETNQAVSVERTVTQELVDHLLEKSREIGVNLTFWSSSDKYSTKSIEALCPWPFERSYISSDMRTSPCCMIANPDVSELGAATDFAGVWKSDAYREFRQAHLDGNIPSECGGCYLGGSSAPAQAEPQILKVEV